MSDEYFTEEKVRELINKNNWELIESDGRYRLRQKDHHHMETMSFDLDDEFAVKYLLTGE